MIYSVLHLNINEKNDSIIFGCVWGIFSAGINYLLTKKFISDQVPHMIDEATGQRIAFRDRSPSCSFPIVIGLGLVVIVIAVFLASALILQKSPKSLLQDTE